MEGDCSWVPFWTDRMDEEWEKRGRVEAPRCPKKPSDYMACSRSAFTTSV
jgi:hypothetical protein